MSTRRYRLLGVDPDDLDNLIEAGSGATLDLLAKALWTEVTVTDGTRDVDLDDFMGMLGYTPDTTGPTIIVNANHSVGTESIVLVNASGGPVQVDLSLTANRLGNDVLVMKIDSSSNAVTVARTGADTIGGATTQTLQQGGESLFLVANATTTDWSIVASTRSIDSYYDNTGTLFTSTNVQDAISEVLTSDLTSIKMFTSGEVLAVGDVLALNTSGEVILADSSIASGNWQVVGVSKEAVAASAPVQVFTKSGSFPNVRFGSAPASSLNGSLVFLDTTTGQASVTPPATTGNTFFTIGTLNGANGVTTTPTIVFRPQFIAHR